MLNIIVLVKQVPEIEKVKFDYESGRINRSSAGVTTNPFDLNAIETAVQIREKVGGYIAAISMGPASAEETLRDALARGADKGILLTDERFAGADTLATAYTLAAAIRKIGRYDLIICGEKTVDGDTAQVGPEVAEFLGVSHAAYVEEVQHVDESRIIVKSRTERNYYTIELSLPALITVTKDINTPRLPSLRDKLRAMRAPIIIWKYEDLSEVADPRYFGFEGSPTRVVRVFTPTTERRRCQMIDGSPEEVAKKIVQLLIEKRILTW
ncbi:MAG: electron transfer flavoprotein subunit beta/FixA family protein [Candidatus Bathyarchaeia archaeon]